MQNDVSLLELVETVIVCAWLVSPVVLAVLMDLPKRDRPTRKPGHNVNH